MSKQHKNNDNDDIIEPIDTNLDDLVSASLTTKRGNLDATLTLIMETT